MEFNNNINFHMKNINRNVKEVIYTNKRENALSSV